MDRSVSHYKIIGRLGAGGMGEVFLAEDTRTGRKVALKLLPQEYTSHPERVLRFQQEARAILALNHPNIVTIYEIGIADDSHFIATEFIQGETLRQVMMRGLKLEQTLDIVIQVASALVAAHEAGIVHRDIKPENIMIRPDGYVKVLDFGLAKLNEADASVVDSGAPTRVNIKTGPGLVMGTVNYMSPEQVRGIPVDERTDLWSLGVVLYEMVTGHPAFSGETSGDVISAILEKQAAPLARYSRDAPEALEEIVTTALAKAREERFQTATQMMASLRRLKQRIEAVAEIERSTTPEKYSAGSITRNVQAPLVVTDKDSRAQTSVVSPVRTTSSAEYMLREIKRHKLGVAVIALIILSLAGVVYLYSSRTRNTVIESIAVLPFINESADQNTEYLSDGITESLIYSLSQLPQLKVMASNSVFRYKGRNIDPHTVGQELGVRAVLTGKITQRGDALFISAELVDAQDNRLLWGEQYNRKFGDILAVQEEISREISQKLRLRLSGEEQKRLAKRYTENPVAYELYLKGNHFVGGKITEEGINKSIGYYQQAINLDPNYAQAYASLAEAYMSLGGVYGFRSPKDTFPLAKTAMQKALDLDDTLADAHWSLGSYKLFYEWDFPGAAQELRRSIELNPSKSSSHVSYGTYFQAMGQLDKAVAERKLARELDPLTPSVIANVGYPHYYARQYDQAIEYYRKALEIDPNFSWSYLWIGQVHLQEGRYDEGIVDIKKAITLSEGNVRAVATLGYAYAVAGRREEATQIIKQLVEDSKKRYVSPYFIATVYAGLSQKEETFAWLEKAYEERYPYLILIKAEPVFDKLHSDPRFADLTKRIGLP